MIPDKEEEARNEVVLCTYHLLLNTNTNKLASLEATLVRNYDPLNY